MNLDRLRDFINDPGTRIGKYEILRKVGEGGMGVVYEAFDPDLRRSVALKVLKKADADRLRREASAAAKLRHPNIVTIHEVGPEYIAMEFVAGKSPAKLDRRTLKIVAGAVAHAHAQGVVHRDLKPGNILIDADGRVVLTDFGLAAERAGGTPGYAAPEGVTGPEADVWALGVMAREAGLAVPRAKTAAEFAQRIGRPPLLPILAAIATLIAVVVLWPRAKDPLAEWQAEEERLTRAISNPPDRVDLLIARSQLRMARTDFGRNRGRNPLPDYLGAEEDLTRAMKVDPASEEIRFRRGVVRTQRAVYKVKYGLDPLSDCAGAEEDLTQVINYPGARTWRGNVRFHRGAWLLKSGGDPAVDFTTAESDLTPAEDADRLMRRARVRAYQKRFDEAERDFDESLRRSPSNVWAWTWRGNARLSAGDWAGAEAHLSKAIAVDADFSEAWEQRGNARFEKGDYSGAASDLRRALTLNPSLEPLLASRLEEARRRSR